MGGSTSPQTHTCGSITQWIVSHKTAHKLPSPQLHCKWPTGHNSCSSGLLDPWTLSVDLQMANIYIYLAYGSSKPDEHELCPVGLLQWSWGEGSLWAVLCDTIHWVMGPQVWVCGLVDPPMCGSSSVGMSEWQLDVENVGVQLVLCSHSPSDVPAH
jgi:hypothetical protein